MVASFYFILCPNKEKTKVHQCIKNDSSITLSRLIQVLAYISGPYALNMHLKSSFFTCDKSMCNMFTFNSSHFTVNQSRIKSFFLKCFCFIKFISTQFLLYIPVMKKLIKESQMNNLHCIFNLKSRIKT